MPKPSFMMHRLKKQLKSKIIRKHENCLILNFFVNPKTLTLFYIQLSYVDLVN